MIALARLLPLASLLALAGRAAAQDVAEPICLVEALGNGDFADGLVVLEGEARGRIPWWIQRPAEGLEFDELDGEPGVWTRDAETLQQAFAVYAPLLDSLVVRGRVGGWGLVTLIDGRSGVVNVPEQGIHGGMADFELPGSYLRAAFGRTPSPRLVLQLGLDPESEGATGPRRARWADLEVLVALPCPSEASLRAEVLTQLRGFFDTWRERAMDDVGPRRTSFLTRQFDAVTGEPIGAPATRAHPLNPVYADLLWRAVRAEPGEAGWGEQFERYVADFLELGLHPDTGLPCYWNPVEDVRLEDVAVQIARPLRFLIDLAEGGPPDIRARARAAAVRIGELVLAQGVAPDGTVATTYRPRDGERYFDAPPIRRLDVPAQLARLAELTGDERYERVAHDALLEVEFTHYWPGKWDSIDPGFDDSFGHYAERALVIWRALEGRPAGAAARRLAMSGFEKYGPLWRDALRFGGNVAADQVRCWRIFAEVAELVPERRAEVELLLDLAVRSHFKGEQIGTGAWIDTTVVGFGPKQLPVGDTGGVPQNLLEGLAVVYGHSAGLRTDANRARFTAVLRATDEAFGAAYGHFAGGRRSAGANPASGSVQLGFGLVEMLDALSAP